MKKLTLYFFLIGLIFLIPQHLFSSDDNISVKLDSLAKKIPALNEKVDISVTNVSIQEFMRAVSKLSGLNLNVEPAIDIQVINNFSQVAAGDIIAFFCNKYDLKFEAIGNIINIYQDKKEFIDTVKHIHYDIQTQRISIDYSNYDLREAVRQITNETSKNIVLSPNVDQKTLNTYIVDMPFETAIEKMAFANNLELEKTDDGYYVLHKIQLPANKAETGKVTVANQPQTSQNSRLSNKPSQDIQIAVHDGDTVEVYAQEVGLGELVYTVCSSLEKNFMSTIDINETVNVSFHKTSFENLLQSVFQGQKFTYKLVGDNLIIGGLDAEGFKQNRVIRFENRTIDKILEQVPEEFAQGLTVQEFPELNSLLVNGPINRIEEYENFVKELDQIVPVILIEVLIIDFNKSSTLSTGISAGYGEAPEKSQGKLFPGVDVQLSTGAINELINSFNGFGWVKLGNVSNQFYMNLKALESQGILNLRSTPKLSTLNGHEAELKIGNMEYYLEEQSNVIGAQNPQLTTTRSYKEIEANLEIKIKPIVSGDEQITLEINVVQSDFTERISEFAPPGKVTRDFKSLIRVKNQEMVLLGGLEENRTSNSGTGTPFLQKIPIIKWFFSSRTKDDSKSKLNVFIRPTIIS